MITVKKYCAYAVIFISFAIWLALANMINEHLDRNIVLKISAMIFIRVPIYFTFVKFMNYADRKFNRQGANH